MEDSVIKNIIEPMVKNLREVFLYTVDKRREEIEKEFYMSNKDIQSVEVSTYIPRRIIIVYVQIQHNGCRYLVKLTAIPNTIRCEVYRFEGYTEFGI